MWPIRKEVICGWRKLQNEGRIHDLYTLTNITGLMNSRRIRWVGHVACMRERRNSFFKFSVILCLTAHHLRSDELDSIGFSLSPPPRHYSPEWTSASFKSFLHPSRFRETTVQFLHPSFAAPSFTPSSQRNLGLPLGRFPPGSLRRTFLDKSSSSWRMTCPAHLNLLHLQNVTMSFSPHN